MGNIINPKESRFDHSGIVDATDTSSLDLHLPQEEQLKQFSHAVIDFVINKAGPAEIRRGVDINVVNDSDELNPRLIRVRINQEQEEENTKTDIVLFSTVSGPSEGSITIATDKTPVADFWGGVERAREVISYDTIAELADSDDELDLRMAALLGSMRNIFTTIYTAAEYGVDLHTNYEGPPIDSSGVIDGDELAAVLDGMPQEELSGILVCQAEVESIEATVDDLLNECPDVVTILRKFEALDFGDERLTLSHLEVKANSSDTEEETVRMYKQQGLAAARLDFSTPTFEYEVFIPQNEPENPKIIIIDKLAREEAVRARFENGNFVEHGPIAVTNGGLSLEVTIDDDRERARWAVMCEEVNSTAPTIGKVEIISALLGYLSGLSD